MHGKISNVKELNPFPTCIINHEKKKTMKSVI